MKTITQETFNQIIQIFCFSLLVLLFSVKTATADESKNDKVDTKKVKNLFKDGVDKYDAGKYEEALEKFEEAYGIKEHQKILYNIAWCYSKLEMNVEAIEAFVKYLEEAKDESEDVLNKVREEISRLEKLVARVSIKCPKKGIVVKVDGNVVWKTPFSKPIYLEPGKHTFSAKLSGFKPFFKGMYLNKGADIELNIIFEPVAKIKPPALEKGTLGIQSNIKGATLYIDGVTKGKLYNRSKIKLKPGKRKLTAILVGYDKIEKYIEIKGGVKTEIKLNFVKIKAKGSLKITTNVEEPFIEIDDLPHTTSSELPIPMDEGTHRVKVYSNNRMPWEGEVDIRPGEDLNVDVTLLKDKKKLRQLFSATFILGLMSLAVMTGTGAKTLGLRNSYEDAKKRGDPRSELEDLYNEGRNYQITTDVLLGLSAALLLCSFFTLGSKPFKKESKAVVAASSQGLVLKW